MHVRVRKDYRCICVCVCVDVRVCAHVSVFVFLSLPPCLSVCLILSLYLVFAESQIPLAKDRRQLCSTRDLVFISNDTLLEAT